MENSGLRYYEESHLPLRRICVGCTCGYLGSIAAAWDLGGVQVLGLRFHCVAREAWFGRAPGLELNDIILVMEKSGLYRSIRYGVVGRETPSYNLKCSLTTEGNTGVS